MVSSGHLFQFYRYIQTQNERTEDDITSEWKIKESRYSHTYFPKNKSQGKIITGYKKP